MAARRKLFVEAVPLVDKQVSGVPHALAGLVAALAANKSLQQKYEIVLVAPGNRMHLLDRWPGLESCTRKPIPMKFRIMNGLGRRGLLPPMDMLLGQGVYLFGNFFNWPLTKRSQSLTYIHDICFAIHPEYVQPDNQRMLKKNVPRYIKQTDYVITVSESAKQEIVGAFGVDPDNVIVLYNGVNSDLYRQYPASEVEPVKKKYGLAGKKYFLFIGNIEPRKNLERLVRAMLQVPKEYALLMVGSDGWLNEKVFAAIDEAHQKGHTIIKPRTFVDDQDVARLISGATALAQPSLYEGFGMPPLEAAVSSTLVVAADIPPLHEVLDESAIFCDPKSIDSIAIGLNRAVLLPEAEKRTIIEAAFRHTQRFTWEASAQRLADVLEQIDKQPQR